MPKKPTWKWEDREYLKHLVDHLGYPPTIILQSMDISRSKLLRELQKGCPEEDYEQRIYKNYDPYRAAMNAIREDHGPGIEEALRRYFKQHKGREDMR